jgi:hypothetical protein
VSENVKPAVGQVWQDCDPRIPKRYVRIRSIENGKAACEAWYVGEKWKARRVRIRLDRFRPTSTGYRYLRTEDVAL